MESQKETQQKDTKEEVSKFIQKNSLPLDLKSALKRLDFKSEYIRAAAQKYFDFFQDDPDEEILCSIDSEEKQFFLHEMMVREIQVIAASNELRDLEKKYKQKNKNFKDAYDGMESLFTFKETRWYIDPVNNVIRKAPYDPFIGLYEIGCFIGTLDSTKLDIINDYLEFDTNNDFPEQLIKGYFCEIEETFTKCKETLEQPGIIYEFISDLVKLLISHGDQVKDIIWQIDSGDIEFARCIFKDNRLPKPLRFIAELRLRQM